MIDVVIRKSHNPRKKYDAVFNAEKTISFGAAGYEDFTIHKDSKRREIILKDMVMRIGLDIMLNLLLG